MWVMSTIGFFSIVRKKDGAYHIRGRLERDLANLKESAKLPEPVSESDRADYRWRIVTNREGYIKVMIALSNSIDYENFKEEIQNTPDQEDKLSAYHEVWHQLYRLQIRDEYRTGKRVRDPVQPTLEDLGLPFGDDDLDALMDPNLGVGWQTSTCNDDETGGDNVTLDEAANRLMYGLREGAPSEISDIHTPYSGTFDRDLTLLVALLAATPRWGISGCFYGLLFRWAFGRVHGCRVRVSYAGDLPLVTVERRTA